MAHINAKRTEIIDLDKETITNIDHEKKQYSVMTFQQLKQQMEEAMKKAQQQSKEANAQRPQMNFKVTVRNTNAAKNVAGLEAKEAILNMVMEAADQQSGQKGSIAVTNDMWMAQDIPGYEEAREFNRRLALKMGMIFGSAFQPSIAAMQPGSAEAMAEMVKEMSKLKGVPVMQVMRMGTSTNDQPIPAASEAPLPASDSPQMPSAGEVAQQSATSAITSKLGGLGGLGGIGRKKKQEQNPQQTTAQPVTGQDAASSVLLESTTEMSGFSSGTVDPAELSVPTGYAQTAAEQK
jgi:hypothetical protein